jgi:hypothetical protein
MFVQVIEGHTDDAAGVRRQMERWDRDVRPGAVGFEGSTQGVTADGTVIVLARFRDAAAAKENADRPEQGAWWRETEPLFTEPPTFRESSDTDTLFDGGSDDAGFVQVMAGTALDRAAIEAFESDELTAQLREARPDLLGGHRVWFEDGSYVEAAYFTSEEAARAGEASDAFSGPQEEYTALFGEMRYLDLSDPTLL